LKSLILNFEIINNDVSKIRTEYVKKTEAIIKRSYWSRREYDKK